MEDYNFFSKAHIPSTAACQKYLSSCVVDIGKVFNESKIAMYDCIIKLKFFLFNKNINDAKLYQAMANCSGR